ncbi:uncharacterized protein LOC106871426 isoform X2 [Octopus bimaculoides]|uniref:uncharacterized protein LOC106871426 isoform X2 n=1 Tax=Octopus bimaculoides TaxID=37653 RepID=UPI00071DF418|nr:uncharacterized protein LOC106871426 isoform X2 [Octopus bimaculoides]|eukprot:XP_014773360.1 PREDICTED: uncharacterized protein LOC106871426 isoform X2 [Octopus bimaculoides]
MRVMYGPGPIGLPLQIGVASLSMSHGGHRPEEMKSDSVHPHIAGHHHHPGHHHAAEEEEYVIEVDSDLSPTGPDIIREVDHDHHNVKVKLKRRRRCGICGPCQIKQNCGRCHYCLRRDVLKQTCVYRKCVYLRSKPRSMSPKENVSMSALNLQSGLGVATPTDLSIRTSLTQTTSGTSSNDFQGLSSMYHHPDLDSRAFTGSSPSIPLHHDPVIPSRMNPYMGGAHTGPYPINMFPSSSLAANSSLPSPFQMGSCSNSPFRYPWMPGSFARPSVVSSPTDLLRPSPSWPPPPPPTHGLSSTHQRMASDFGANSFQKDMPFMKRRSQQDLLQNRQRLPSCSRSLAPMCGSSPSGCETPACFNSDALVMREKYSCFPGQGSRSIGCDNSGHMTSGTLNSSYNRGCASSQHECDVIGIDDLQVNAFIRASGYNGLDIEVDISKLPIVPSSGKSKGKSTLNGMVSITQDLGDKGTVELQVPGYKVTLEDHINVDEMLAKYTSSLKPSYAVKQPKIELID